jgi:hypothetical protein
MEPSNEDFFQYFRKEGTEKTKSLPVIALKNENIPHRAWASFTSHFYTNTFKDSSATAESETTPTATPSMSQPQEKDKDYTEIDWGFTPYENKVVHQHDHLSFPHIHRRDCNRLVSGSDKNRDKRFYFTRNVTPVRVYVRYEHTGGSKSAKKLAATELPKFAHYNGQKLNANVLRNTLGMSNKFIKEASNLVFVHESLSFIPADQSAKTRAKLHNKVAANSKI